MMIKNFFIFGILFCSFYIVIPNNGYCQISQYNPRVCFKKDIGYCTSSLGHSWNCNNESIRGAWACSSSSSSFNVSSNTDDNKHCWCRMLHPFLGSWFFSGTSFQTAWGYNDCYQNCGNMCPGSNNVEKMLSGL